MDILGKIDDKRTDPMYDHRICYIPFAFHLVPLVGLAKVASVMRCGERLGRGGKESWEKVPIEEHLNHAVAHILAYLAGRHEEHHLANAGCRVLMALDLDKEDVLPSPSLDSLKSRKVSLGLEELWKDTCDMSP